MTIGSTDPSLVVALSSRDPHLGAGDDRHDLSTDVVLAGLERFCARTGSDASATAVAIAVRGADAAVAAARDRGFGTVLAVESPDQDGFTLADGDGFARAIEHLDPTLTSVRVAWHPADHPDRKKEQALGLTKLGAWLHETGRRLLVEVLVLPTEQDLAVVGGDRARFDTERRPGLVVEAVREIRDLGTEPDLWAVEPPGDERQTLLELVRDAGRDQVGLLTLLRDPTATVGAVDPSDASGSTGSVDTGGVTRGIVLDRAVWAPAVRVETDAAERAATGEDAAEAVASALERSARPSHGSA